MFGFLATVVVAVSTACNPLVAIGHDAANLSTLQDDMRRSSSLGGVSAVSVKGRLAVVKDANVLGGDPTKWVLRNGPAPVMEAFWNATYTRNSPRDPYRTFTFVEVLNAQGRHLITLIPPGC